jgi:diaminohydroxyphosphoribosylaminopyrimidine deaminase/5-amino-6-(5-phosphoribosylamino)uracil reductase
MSPVLCRGIFIVEMIIDKMLKQDEKWMAMALELAERAAGHTSPNPLVGAVIVRDGEVIGTGWHEYCGGLHAERNALADCCERGNDPVGATMYVTLEPCCHYGKTPPCTEAIIENRLGRVVYGAYDPNPAVAGKGLQILKDAGITVDGPVLNKECLDINEIFFHYITTGTPYVIMKYAMTADGKIAAYTGDSRWVTGEKARKHTHYTRKRVAAIMVGIGTVLSDDPMLNCRLDADMKRDGTPYEKPVDPVRVICDSSLRIPLDSQIVKTAGDIRTIAACLPAEEDDAEKLLKKSELEKAGVEILEIPPDKDGHVSLPILMQCLGKEGLDSVLLEGGAELNFSALQSGIVNKLHVYIAPKLIGGVKAKSPVGGKGIPAMSDSIKLSRPKITALDDDLLMEYTFVKQL